MNDLRLLQSTFLIIFVSGLISRLAIASEVGLLDQHSFCVIGESRLGLAFYRRSWRHHWRWWRWSAVFSLDIFKACSTTSILIVFVMFPGLIAIASAEIV